MKSFSCKTFVNFTDGSATNECHVQNDNTINDSSASNGELASGIVTSTDITEHQKIGQIVDIRDHANVFVFDPRNNISNNFRFDKCYKNIDPVSFCTECNINLLLKETIFSGYNASFLILDDNEADSEPLAKEKSLNITKVLLEYLKSLLLNDAFKADAPNDDVYLEYFMNNEAAIRQKSLSQFSFVEDFASFECKVEEFLRENVCAKQSCALLSLKLTVGSQASTLCNIVYFSEIYSFGLWNDLCVTVNGFFNGSKESFVLEDEVLRLIFKLLMDNCCMNVLASLTVQNSFSGVATKSKQLLAALTCFDSISRRKEIVWSESSVPDAVFEEYKQASLVIVEALENELKKVKLVKESLSKELGKIKKEIVQFQTDMHCRYDLYEVEETKKFETEKLMHQSALQALAQSVNETQAELLSISKSYHLDVEKYHIEIRSLQQALHASQQQDEDLRQSLDSLNYKYNLLNDERKKEKDNHDASKIEYENKLKTTKSSFNEQINALKKLNSTLSENITTISAEKDLLQTEIAQLENNKLIQNSELKCKLDRALLASKESQKSLQKISEEKAEFEDIIEELKEKENIANNQISLLKKKIDLLKDSSKKTPSNDAAFEAEKARLHDQISALMEELQTIKTENHKKLLRNEDKFNSKYALVIKKLESELEQERENTLAYEEQKMSFHQANQEALLKIKKLEMEISLFKSKSSSNTSSAQDVHQFKSEITDLKYKLELAEMKRSEEIREAVNKERSAMKAERLEMQKILRESQSRILELENAVKTNSFSVPNTKATSQKKSHILTASSTDAEDDVYEELEEGPFASAKDASKRRAPPRKRGITGEPVSAASLSRSKEFKSSASDAADVSRPPAVIITEQKIEALTKPQTQSAPPSPIAQKLRKSASKSSVTEETLSKPKVKAAELQNTVSSMVPPPPSPKKMSTFTPRAIFMPNFENSVMSNVSFDSTNDDSQKKTKLNGPGAAAAVLPFERTRILNIPKKKPAATETAVAAVASTSTIPKNIYDSFRIPAVASIAKK